MLDGIDRRTCFALIDLLLFEPMLPGDGRTLGVTTGSTADPTRTRGLQTVKIAGLALVSVSQVGTPRPLSLQFINVM